MNSVLSPQVYSTDFDALELGPVRDRLFTNKPVFARVKQRMLSLKEELLEHKVLLSFPDSINFDTVWG